MTYRLKTATEAEMLTALKSVLLCDEDGELILATHNYWVYPIDTLPSPTGVILTDGDGNEYPEKSPIAGYHANLKTNDQKIVNALKSITINVDKPLLKVAGEK